MKESTTYQAILEEGRVKGRVVGRAEGRVEGVCDILISFGSEKLGPPDAETLAALRAIRDVQQLLEMARRLRNSATWSELLTTASPW